MDVHKVIGVLDAALNFTAIHSCVTGMQLRYPDAGVTWSLGVALQLNSVQIIFTDAYLSLQKHNNGCDLFFCDMAPFNTIGKGVDGGSTRVFNSVVLQMDKYGFS